MVYVNTFLVQKLLSEKDCLNKKQQEIIGDCLHFS
jgi:hypothetical protein